jgi:predicted transposase YbfD/YdcC
MKSTTIVEQIEIPAWVVELEAASLYAVLQRVKDLRKRRGRRYEAGLLLVLILLAKLAGMKTIAGVAEWVELRGEWLSSVLGWSRLRFPCANTYRYLCEHIDVAELNQVLGAFFAQLYASMRPPPESAVGADKEEPAEVEQSAQRHLALDGKSLRGTRRLWPVAQAAQQVLGLYDVSDDYMVQQVAIAGKGQERAAGDQPLRQLDLQGCLVSADALHTQPKWCAQILAQGGDYLVIAKANQSQLRAEIALLFGQPPLPWLPESQAMQTNKAHGRLEVRQMRTSAELADFLAPKWPGVQQVFQLQRRIWRQGQLATDVVYGMTSLPPKRTPVTTLLALVRAHWHIENRSHWRRDVTLGEDHCKVASALAPQVLSALNNVVLALMDYLEVDNVASQIRRFDAAPAEALALLMAPL